MKRSLSGPYDKRAIEQMTGEAKDSPLRQRRAKRSTQVIPRWALPEIGQKVLGTAPTAFNGWYTGVITEIRKDANIVIITFDNGKTLGAPNAVTTYWPLLPNFKGKSGPYGVRKASLISSKFGLRIA
jgi:hypothetical protein